MIRFAVIGSGGIAAKHAQAIAAIPGAYLARVWHLLRSREHDNEVGESCWGM